MLDSYKEFKEFLSTLDYRPSLLLHSCCAPCSSHVILLLKDYFDITIFYSNDNISPLEEYEKRLAEEIRFCKEIDSSIKVIFDVYKKEDYEEAVKGYEALGERTERCYKCYQLRLEKTAKKAKELGFDYFTTTLSISPHKITSWINEIGKSLEEKYEIAYLFSDFKKEEGYKHSIELSKKYGLYRQDYCGCLYSKQERNNQNAEK
ncbi:MAG: epoxyqueuosine reductase QueH [Anaeroplasmataceae bacterium]|nr:epoxyqueuosine reductase QueH [Anaeroplasmataceae bacterium]MDE6414361.1 epoxyqueuosine reductase QueH [Anaeroplasmataceae bacterium]